MTRELMTWTGPHRQVISRSDTDRFTSSRYVTVVMAEKKRKKIKFYSWLLKLKRRKSIPFLFSATVVMAAK
jgi:hypothetical protein